MAWVCVGYSGEELVFVNKPHRRISKNEFYFDETDMYKHEFYFDENDIYKHEWIDDEYCGCINLPKGSIKKLIGRGLSWEDEPVELREKDSYEQKKQQGTI